MCSLSVNILAALDLWCPPVAAEPVILVIHHEISYVHLNNKWYVAMATGLQDVWHNPKETYNQR